MALRQLEWDQRDKLDSLTSSLTNISFSLGSAGPFRQQDGRRQEQALVEGQEGWQEEDVSSSIK